MRIRSTMLIKSDLNGVHVLVEVSFYIGTVLSQEQQQDY